MTQNETFEKKLAPLENENVEDFVERVAGERSEGVTLVKKIEDHYGYDHRKSKELILDSRSYWRRFFLDEIKERFDSEGSR